MRIARQPTRYLALAMVMLFMARHASPEDSCYLPLIAVSFEPPKQGPEMDPLTDYGDEAEEIVRAAVKRSEKKILTALLWL